MNTADVWFRNEVMWQIASNRAIIEDMDESNKRKIAVTLFAATLIMGLIGLFFFQGDDYIILSFRCGIAAGTVESKDKLNHQYIDVRYPVNHQIYHIGGHAGAEQGYLHFWVG